MKIIFISPAISAVHIRKRVTGLVDAGLEVIVYAFDRGDKASNEYPENVKVINLGYTPNDKGYFSKFFKYIPILRKIFKEYKNEDVLYFVCAFDLALITKLFSGKRYFYHISDLVYGYFSSKIQPIFRVIDQFIISSAQRVVVTSEGFKDYLSTPKTATKFIYQPNSLSNAIYNSEVIDRKIESVESLNFAFIGFVRFKSIFKFAEVIGKHFPQHKFLFFGKALEIEVLDKMVTEYKNIEYFGTFKSPDDLSNIYSKVDIVVSCYDTKSLNVRLAEPNKLFESLYFAKPIVVSSNTILEKQVLRLGAGWGVDANQEQSIIGFVESLTLNNIQSVVKNISTVDKSLLIDDNSIQIAQAIKKLK